MDKTITSDNMDGNNIPSVTELIEKTASTVEQNRQENATQNATLTTNLCSEQDFNPWLDTKPFIGKTTVIQRDLIEAGITKSLINKYLPNHEEIKRSHHAGFIYLYACTEILAVAERDDFKIDFTKAQLRRIKAKACYNKLIREKIDALEKLKISISDWTVDQLVKGAIRSWEGHNSDCWYSDATSPATKRITLNFIRHELTEYPNWLRTMCTSPFGTVNNDLHYYLQGHIAQQVYKSFPELL